MIIGATKFNWFGKSHNHTYGKPAVFVETPYVYKVDIAASSVPLLNGQSAPWIATPTYDDILSKLGSIWDPGLHNDPSQSMVQCPYKKICSSQTDTNCCLEDGASIGGGTGEGPYTGWCNKGGDVMKTPWSVCCTCGTYCNPKPRFNWVIGVCKGVSCKAGYDPTKMVLPAWYTAKDYGSDGLINYVGAYQYNTATGTWDCQMDCSFNMDGRHGAYDLSKTNGGMSFSESWLPGPNPGGACNWGAGFYPAGRTGVGPPAMAFILSVERVFNFAWYILNQAALDRGPQDLMSDCQNCMKFHNYSDTQVNGIKQAGNTWLCARSGEWDLLESPMFGQVPNINDDKGAVKKEYTDYRKLYSNNIINAGSNGKASAAGLGSTNSADQSWGSTHYFQADEMGDLSAASPRVFFAIIDYNGTTIFQIPTGDGAPSYWSGINRKTAVMRLPGKFSVEPSTGPTIDLNKFSAIFLPGCQAQNGNEREKFNCSNAGNDAGMCNNLTSSLTDTGNVWGKTKALGGVVSWTVEMENLM